MPQTSSNRIIATPSTYAKDHYLYVQEVGTLQSLESHISSRKNLNSYLFFAVIDGRGLISINDKNHVISAGDCVWLDCTLPYFHQSSSEDPWTLMWVHFYGQSAKSFYQNFIWHDNASVFRPDNFPDFTEILAHLFQNQQSKSSLTELVANKYLTDLITLCYTQGHIGSKKESSTGEKLKQIHSYLENHYDEKISLESLASQFFISKYHLSREYKKLYGITLLNDLTSRRISHAKELLRFTQNSVEFISQKCGYQEMGYFIKVFHKSENMTPLEYRKMW